MADDFVWSPEALIQQVDDGCDRNLSEAVRLVRDEARAAVSVKGSPTGKYRKNPKKGSKSRKQILTPSAPGEPPHTWTGRLRRGISSTVNKRKHAGYVKSIGGGVMEFGSSKMAARPFLRPTLAKLRGAIAAILTRPVNSE